MRRQTTRSLSAFMSLVLANCALGLILVIFPVRGEAGSPNPPVEEFLGAWKLRYTSPDGKARECVITLSREGTVLRGDYWDGKTIRPAKNVGFSQGELSFGVDGKYAGRVYTLTYKGRPRGNQLRGAVYWKYGWASGSFDFVGNRVSQSVASVP